MSRTLYLLVTSERPDQYINAVVHCLLFMPVERVVFLHVREVGSKQTVQQTDLSSVVLRNVQILLDRLANAQYRYFSGENAGKIVDLATEYDPQRLDAIRDLYQQCLGKPINWGHKAVGYLELRSELARIRKSEPDSIFDVTAVSKSLLGDVVAVCILEGVNNLHTFDLQVRPNFDQPWRMLLHDLQTKGDERKYSYVNILDTPVFRDSARSILVRTPPLVFSLVAAFVLLTIALIAYLASGGRSVFLQVTFIASAVASLLSVFLNFFPARR